MTKVRENRYEMSFGNYVGVIVDEELMKKLAKVQYETKEKILELLENNKDKHWNYSWSIADEPEEVEQGERSFKYIDHGQQHLALDRRIRNMFNIKKMNALYDVGNKGWPGTRELAEKEHIAHLNGKEVNH